jgi:hypothetical protein
MAIKYEEIYSEVMNKELSMLELKYIDEAEQYIDNEIIEQFGKQNFIVEIPMSVSTFRWSPKTNKLITELMDVRKPHMTKELRRRFEESGWEIKIDGRDLFDVWILKGKKN